VERHETHCPTVTIFAVSGAEGALWKGGLLDFLRTTQPVASALLPDIVALDVAELEQAVNLGVLQPLDSTLSRTITPRCTPSPGRRPIRWAHDGASVYRGHRARGLQPGPAVAAAQHLDRHPGEKTPYLFPAGSPQSPAAAALRRSARRRAVISQYLSAGGTIEPKTRQDILDFSGLDEIWSSYAQGGAALADVSARRYLANREALPNTAPRRARLVESGAAHRRWLGVSHHHARSCAPEGCRRAH